MGGLKAEEEQETPNAGINRQERGQTIVVFAVKLGGFGTPDSGLSSSDGRVGTPNSGVWQLRWEGRNPEPGV